MARELLTIFEVSQMTKFAVPTLRKYVLHREIPFYKVKRRLRFASDEIEAWIESGGNCAGMVGTAVTAPRAEENGLLFEGAE